MLARDAERLSANNAAGCFPPEVMENRASWSRAFAGFAQQDANEAFQPLMNRCDEADANALHAVPTHRNVPRVLSLIHI